MKSWMKDNRRINFGTLNDRTSRLSGSTVSLSWRSCNCALAESRRGSRKSLHCTYGQGVVQRDQARAVLMEDDRGASDSHSLLVRELDRLVDSNNTVYSRLCTYTLT